jgi:hypothetical protein
VTVQRPPLRPVSERPRVRPAWPDLTRTPATCAVGSSGERPACVDIRKRRPGPSSKGQFPAGDMVASERYFNRCNESVVDPAPAAGLGQRPRGHRPATAVRVDRYRGCLRLRNRKKHHLPGPDATTGMEVKRMSDKNIHVVPRDRRWAVEREDSQRASALHDTQALGSYYVPTRWAPTTTPCCSSSTPRRCTPYTTRPRRPRVSSRPSRRPSRRAAPVTGGPSAAPNGSTQPTPRREGARRGVGACATQP